MKTRVSFIFAFMAVMFFAVVFPQNNSNANAAGPTYSLAFETSCEYDDPSQDDGCNSAGVVRECKFGSWSKCTPQPCGPCHSHDHGPG